MTPSGGRPLVAEGRTEQATTRRGRSRRSRRASSVNRSFSSTVRALDALTQAGAQVSVHVADLDREIAIASGDDFITYPIADLGSVALLIEAAVRLADGRLDADEPVDIDEDARLTDSGIWRHLQSQTLRVGDLPVLSAAVGDTAATNALIKRIGLRAVHDRMTRLGFKRTALLDRHRDVRGPDDAPHVALGSTHELAIIFSRLVNSQIVDPFVSMQVAEWLNLNADLSLVGSATGLDPLRHETDEHGLLFINKTGRADGVRAEAGVLAGPRAGVSYAMTVVFSDDTISHRLRVHDAMRTFGMELMEFVH